MKWKKAIEERPRCRWNKGRNENRRESLVIYRQEAQNRWGIKVLSVRSVLYVEKAIVEVGIVREVDVFETKGCRASKG